MPGRGVLFALSPVEEAQLLARREAKVRAVWVATVLEENWDRDWLLEMGMVWPAVHYCLHGAHAYPMPGAPAEAKAVFGGDAIGVSGLFSIDYKSHALTKAIASGLSKMRDEALWARAGLIERKEYEGPKGEAVQAAVVHAVHALKDFYRKAAEAGRAVIFTVDM